MYIKKIAIQDEHLVPPTNRFSFECHVVNNKNRPVIGRGDTEKEAIGDAIVKGSPKTPDFDHEESMLHTWRRAAHIEVCHESYTNLETFLVASWIDSNEVVLEVLKKEIHANSYIFVGNDLFRWVHSRMPEVGHELILKSLELHPPCLLALVGDMAQAGLGRVNWGELAKDYVKRTEENPPCVDEDIRPPDQGT